MSGECTICSEHYLDCKCEIKVEFKEKVDHPLHYKGKRIEAIDVIEDFELNFNLGNVVKYVLRAMRKEDYIQDLKKARWYLEREINNCGNR